MADMDFAMLGCDTLPDFAATFQQQPMQLDDSQDVPTFDLITSDHEDGGLRDTGVATTAFPITPTHIPISCACCGHQSRDDTEANNFVHVGPLATHK